MNEMIDLQQMVIRHMKWQHEKWSQNNDIKYAISPYYVYGFVDSDGNDMPYLTCDRGGPVTEERLINHKPSK